ncbi:MAG TPA: tyrosine/phenylalanine carboxypeptidase domain-containing protein, partial [Candidatus Saccharimonadales bacterium]|nr:tyrosine/phenylalanine carboxypeptidase domain-containing protein [Candidatus Saccharimonadales bacterium]
YRKKIIIGKHFSANSTHRLKQIVAHEVGCHVQRAMSDRRRSFLAQFDDNDEGLAIVLEQLFASRFMYKRVLRYFAIALAIGVDGKKRDFCDVYEILWRTMRVISGNSPKDSKIQAFYETARAFRGGIPSEPGMAYLKDKVYLESNLIIWEKLEERLLDSDEFRRLFLGHNNVLVRR